jgi:protein TonB
MAVTLIQAREVPVVAPGARASTRAASRPSARKAPTLDVAPPFQAPPVRAPDPTVLSQPESSAAASADVAPATDPSGSDEAVAESPTTILPPPASPTEESGGPSAALERYRPLVLAILERAKRYPLMAQRRGLEGTVEIAFTIAQDGRLSEPEVVATSRHSVLDDATLDMVRRIGSLPPPPDPNPLRFAARIQYKLTAEASSVSPKGAIP